MDKKRVKSDMGIKVSWHSLTANTGENNFTNVYSVFNFRELKREILFPRCYIYVTVE